MKGQALTNVKSIVSASGNWSIDENGLITVKEIKTDKLCVGTRCVTQAEFESIFGAGAPTTTPSTPQTPSPTPTGDTGGTVAGTSTENMVASSSPIVTINGLSPVTVASTTAYVDTGATAVDWSGASVAVTDDISTIDFSIAGSYTIHYSSTDANGTGAATRLVVVE